MKPHPKERFEERLVTYALELEGRFFVIENVPAQVDVESGERFFSLAIVERIQQIIREGGTPTRTIETPVYEFGAEMAAPLPPRPDVGESEQKGNGYFSAGV